MTSSTTQLPKGDFQVTLTIADKAPDKDDTSNSAAQSGASAALAVGIADERPAAGGNEQKTVAEIFAAFVKQHQDEIFKRGMPGLKAFDLMREIVNSKFSQAVIDKALQDPNSRTRALMEEFVAVFSVDAVGRVE
jgi:hypothetical protein